MSTGCVQDKPTHDNAPLGNENTFLSAPALIALFKEEMTCALTSILYLISRNLTEPRGGETNRR